MPYMSPAAQGFRRNFGRLYTSPQPSYDTGPDYNGRYRAPIVRGGQSEQPTIEPPATPDIGMMNRGQISRGPSPEFASRNAAQFLPVVQRRDLEQGMQKQAFAAEMPPQETGHRLTNITEQQARAMWQASNGDESAFGDTVAKYNVNGRALLDHWRKGGTLNNFSYAVPGQFNTTPATPAMPISMLGPDKAGGTPPPGLIAMERGMKIGGSPMTSTPVMGAQQGYTPISNNEAYALPSTPHQNTPGPTTNWMSPGAAENYKRTELENQSHMATRDAQAVPMTPMFNNPEATRLDIAGQAQVAATPPTAREEFNAATDTAQAYANAPVEREQARGDTVRYAADQRLKGDEAKATATTAAAQAKGGGGTRAQDGSRLTWREVNSAYNTMVHNGMNDADIETSLNNRYGPGALDQLRKATTQPSGGAQPSTQQNSAPTTQKSTVGVAYSKDQADQVAANQPRRGPDGKMYAKHSDGLWYPVQ